MKIIKYLLFLVLFCLFLSSCKDSSVEPATQFAQIYLKYDFENELNTFDNTFQKDLIMDGVIKIEFFLTAEEQNQILEKAYSINYFSLPDTFKYIPVNGITLITNPNPGEQVLRIKFQQKDKKIIWTYPLNEDNVEANDLMKLKDFIISIIESKPEYKKLPPAKGGYL